MPSDAILLLRRNRLPVSGNQTGSLNCCLLSYIDIVVCAENLNEEKQRLGMGVVVLLKLGCDGFDFLGIGCKKLEVSTEPPSLPCVQGIQRAVTIDVVRRVEITREQRQGRGDTATHGWRSWTGRAHLYRKGNSRI